MYWYHGSKQSLSVLKKQKAQSLPGRPEGESLEAIYFTPNFAFALACAVRPPGITDMDLSNQTIRFSNPDKFKPDEPVYIYCVDPASIPDGYKVWIDELQIAVTLDEIKPDRVDVYKSCDVFNYYHMIDGPDGTDAVGV